MKKSIVGLFLTLVLLGVVMLACQKEKRDVLQQTTAQQANGRLGLSINQASTRCRILLDTAVKYIKDYRDNKIKEGKKEGEYTKAFIIPADGLLDIFKYAEENNIKLSSVRTYIGIKLDEQGIKRETLIYVGVDENGNDLIPSTAELENPTRPTAPVEDLGGSCPPICEVNSSNVLNSLK